MNRAMSAILSAILIAALLTGCHAASRWTEAESEPAGSDAQTETVSPDLKDAETVEPGNQTTSTQPVPPDAAQTAIVPGADTGTPNSGGQPTSSSPGLEETETVEYSYLYANMKLALPETWQYEILPAGNDENENGFGISFWPEDQPSVKTNLFYYVSGIGLCGTGVTFEDITLSNGLEATKCTEELSDDFWLFLIYHDVPGDYGAECFAPKNLWPEYESSVMAILESAELGINILSETQATAIAKTQCTINYDDIRAFFDHTTGVWKIKFSTDDGADDNQTVWVNAQGEIQDTAYGE